MAKSSENGQMRERRNELRAALRKLFPRDHGQLLPALHHLQHEYGHLPGWAMEVVGWHLGIPSSEVYGAATSYSELRIKEPGTHVLRVCTGLSCWMNGGGDLIERFSATLGVHPGETTSDGSVTLEETPCGYLCGNAPAIELDGVWTGRVTAEAVDSIVGRINAL